MRARSVTERDFSPTAVPDATSHVRVAAHDRAEARGHARAFDGPLTTAFPPAGADSGPGYTDIIKEYSLSPAGFGVKQAQATIDPIIRKRVYKITHAHSHGAHICIPAEGKGAGVSAVCARGVYAYVQLRALPNPSRSAARKQPWLHFMFSLDVVNNKGYTYRLVFSTEFTALGELQMGKIAHIPLPAPRNDRWTVVAIDLPKVLSVVTRGHAGAAGDVYGYVCGFSMHANMIARGVYVSERAFNGDTLPAMIRYPVPPNTRFGSLYEFTWVPEAPAEASEENSTTVERGSRREPPPARRPASASPARTAADAHAPAPRAAAPPKPVVPRMHIPSGSAAASVGSAVELAVGLAEPIGAAAPAPAKSTAAPVTPARAITPDTHDGSTSSRSKSAKARSPSAQGHQVERVFENPSVEPYRHHVAEVANSVPHDGQIATAAIEAAASRAVSTSDAAAMHFSEAIRRSSHAEALAVTAAPSAPPSVDIAASKPQPTAAAAAAAPRHEAVKPVAKGAQRARPSTLPPARGRSSEAAPRSATRAKAGAASPSPVRRVHAGATMRAADPAPSQESEAPASATLDAEAAALQRLQAQHQAATVNDLHVLAGSLDAKNTKDAVAAVRRMKVSPDTSMSGSMALTSTLGCTPAFSSTLQWTPDGRELLFASNRSVIAVPIYGPHSCNGVPAAVTADSLQGTGSSGEAATHADAPPSAGRQRHLLGPHSTDIIGMAMSPDGALLLTLQGGPDPLAVVWDVEAGFVAAVLSHREHGNSGGFIPSGASFSRDASMLCIAGKDARARVTFSVFDVNPVRLRVLRRASSKAIGIAGAPSADGDDAVTAATPPITSLELLARQVSDFAVSVLRFSPYEDDRFVAAGKENVRIYRIKRGHIPGVSVVLNEYARGVEFLDIAFEALLEGTASVPGGGDAEALVAGKIFLASDAGTLTTINYGSRKVESVIRVHASAVRALAVTESFCVTGGADGVVRVWPLDFSEFYWEATHDGAVSSVGVSSNGLMLAVGTDAVAAHISAAATAAIGNESHVRAPVAGSHVRDALPRRTDGTSALAGQRSCFSVGIMDVANGRYRTVARGHGAPVAAVACRPLFPDILAPAVDAVLATLDSPQNPVWAPGDARFPARVRAAFESSAQRMRADVDAVLPREAATASADGTLRVWRRGAQGQDFLTGTRHAASSRASSTMTSTVGSDSSSVVDGAELVWEQVFEFAAQDDACCCLTYHPVYDSSAVADLLATYGAFDILHAASDSSSALTGTSSTAEATERSAARRGMITQLASRSHVLLAGFESGCVRVFHVPSTTLLHEVRAHASASPVHAVAYAPDGTFAFSAGADGRVVQYSTQKSYLPLRQYRSALLPVRCLAARVALAVSPDGSVVAVSFGQFFESLDAAGSVAATAGQGLQGVTTSSSLRKTRRGGIKGSRDAEEQSPSDGSSKASAVALEEVAPSAVPSGCHVSILRTDDLSAVSDVAVASLPQVRIKAMAAAAAAEIAAGSGNLRVAVADVGGVAGEAVARRGASQLPGDRPLDFAAYLGGPIDDVEAAAAAPVGRGGQDRFVSRTALRGRLARELETRIGTGIVQALCFAADGAVMVASTDDWRLLGWSVFDDAEPSRIRPVPLFDVACAHTGHVFSCSPVGNGSVLMTAASDGSIRMWNVAMLMQQAAGAPSAPLPSDTHALTRHHPAMLSTVRTSASSVRQLAVDARGDTALSAPSATFGVVDWTLGVAPGPMSVSRHEVRRFQPRAATFVMFGADAYAARVHAQLPAPPIIVNAAEQEPQHEEVQLRPSFELEDAGESLALNPPSPARSARGDRPYPRSPVSPGPTDHAPSTPQPRPRSAAAATSRSVPATGLEAEPGAPRPVPSNTTSPSTPGSSSSASSVMNDDHGGFPVDLRIVAAIPSSTELDVLRRFLDVAVSGEAIREDGDDTDAPPDRADAVTALGSRAAGTDAGTLDKPVGARTTVHALSEPVMLSRVRSARFDPLPMGSSPSSRTSSASVTLALARRCLCWDPPSGTFAFAAGQELCIHDLSSHVQRALRYDGDDPSQQDDFRVDGLAPELVPQATRGRVVAVQVTRKGDQILALLSTGFVQVWQQDALSAPPVVAPVLSPSGPTTDTPSQSAGVWRLAAVLAPYWIAQPKVRAGGNVGFMRRRSVGAPDKPASSSEAIPAAPGVRTVPVDLSIGPDQTFVAAVYAVYEDDASDEPQLCAGFWELANLAPRISAVATTSRAQQVAAQLASEGDGDAQPQQNQPTCVAMYAACHVPLPPGSTGPATTPCYGGMAWIGTPSVVFANRLKLHLVRIEPNAGWQDANAARPAEAPLAPTLEPAETLGKGQPRARRSSVASLAVLSSASMDERAAVPADIPPWVARTAAYTLDRALAAPITAIASGPAVLPPGVLSSSSSSLSKHVAQPSRIVLSCQDGSLAFAVFEADIFGAYDAVQRRKPAASIRSARTQGLLTAAVYVPPDETPGDSTVAASGEAGVRAILTLHNAPATAVVGDVRLAASETAKAPAAMAAVTQLAWLGSTPTAEVLVAGTASGELLQWTVNDPVAIRMSGVVEPTGDAASTTSEDVGDSDAVKVALRFRHALGAGVTCMLWEDTGTFGVVADTSGVAWLARAPAGTGKAAPVVAGIKSTTLRTLARGPIKVLAAHTGVVDAIACSFIADGTLAGACSSALAAGIAAGWRMPSRPLLAFTSSRSDGTVRVWNVTPRTASGAPMLGGKPTSLGEWSTNAEQLVSLAAPGGHTPTCVAVWHPTPWRDDAGRAAVACKAAVGFDNGSLRVFSLDTMREEVRSKAHQAPPPGTKKSAAAGVRHVTCVAWAVVVCSGATSLTTGRRTQELPCLVSGDGAGRVFLTLVPRRSVMTATASGSVYANSFDLADAAAKSRVEIDVQASHRGNAITSIQALRADPTVVLLASDSGAITVWRLSAAAAPLEAAQEPRVVLLAALCARATLWRQLNKAGTGAVPESTADVHVDGLGELPPTVAEADVADAQADHRITCDHTVHPPARVVWVDVSRQLAQLTIICENTQRVLTAPASNLMSPGMRTAGAFQGGSDEGSPAPTSGIPGTAASVAAPQAVTSAPLLATFMPTSRTTVAVAVPQRAASPYLPPGQFLVFFDVQSRRVLRSTAPFLDIILCMDALAQHPEARAVDTDVSVVGDGAPLASARDDDRSVASSGTRGRRGWAESSVGGSVARGIRDVQLDDFSTASDQDADGPQALELVRQELLRDGGLLLGSKLQKRVWIVGAGDSSMGQVLALSPEHEDEVVAVSGRLVVVPPPQNAARRGAAILQERAPASQLCTVFSSSGGAMNMWSA